MTEDELRFRERLVAAQTQDQALKEGYEQEIKAMLEQKLSKPVKWLLIILIALDLLGVAFTAMNLPRWWSEDLAREMAICFLVFELVVVVCLGWILAQGSLRAAAPGFALALVCGVLSLGAAILLNDIISRLAPDQGPRELPVVVLVLGWLPMVLVTLSYYHSRTREKLLEIQYQLAELAEQVKDLR